MSDNKLMRLPGVLAATGLHPRRTRRTVDAVGVKIPKFTKLKFDPEAERRTRAPAVDQWRVEYPHLGRAYDEMISFGRGGRIKPEDVERIARRHPQRRGKGRGENRDALARSPTGGGRFVDGGEGDWSDHQSATSYDQWYDDPMYDPEGDPEQDRSDHQSATLSDDLDDPMYAEDDSEEMYDPEDDPEDMYEPEDDPARRLILPMKNNLAADATGVAYSVVAPHGTPVVAWTAEPVIITADEALASEGRDGDGQERDRPKRDDAIKWLRNLLTDGPRGAKEVQNEARAAGISIATLRRA
jgi:hypothetical protein